MPRKVPSFDSDKVIQQYTSGSTIAQIAGRIGVSPSCMHKRLRQLGVPMRKGGGQLKSALDPEEIVRQYTSGVGINGIAKIFGVSPRPIQRILRERGHAPRNRSEQQLARMRRATPTERRYLTEPAHVASRGRRASPAELSKRAKSRELRQVQVSHYECRLATMLRERGLEPSCQTAVGPYNCDLTVDAVAVEIFGGKWHWHGDHAARAEERFRHILNAGYHVLIVVIDARRHPLTPEVADYVVAEINRLRSLPPGPREYRMVWGAGQYTTGGRADDEKLLFEPPFTHSRDPKTGRYTTVPRNNSLGP
jgi:very-short-patch-repair endonuclease